MTDAIARIHVPVLADRIVDGRAEAQIIADAAHGEQLRMPAGNEQRHKGKAGGMFGQ